MSLGSVNEGRLLPEEVEAIASRLAELLRAEEAGFPRRGLVTADQVRALLHVERGWVYEHKHELGAVRLGDPRTGPLRFEAARVLGYLRDRRIAQPVLTQHAAFELLPIPS